MRSIILIIFPYLLVILNISDVFIISVVAIQHLYIIMYMKKDIEHKKLFIIDTNLNKSLFTKRDEPNTGLL